MKAWLMRERLGKTRMVTATMASDVIIIRAVVILMVSTLMSGTTASSPGYRGITWLSTPEHVVNCMENTDVIFNWTHTSVPHPVNIAWYYLGTAEYKRLDYILGFNINRSYIPNSHFASRIEYVKFPGSATMILKNVTTTDDGLYEAKVAVLDPELFKNVRYISNITTLNVISGLDIDITISIGGMTFDLSVAENGTSVTLPDITMTSHTELEVIAAVSKLAPQPNSIRIRYQKKGNTHLCTHAYSCTSVINFEETISIFPQIGIAIAMEFGIQNLTPVRIMGVVKPGYEIDLTITINSLTFDLSLAENGTRVMLPDVMMTSSAVLEVVANVSQMAPQPNNITISIEPEGYTYSCRFVYVCTSNIDLDWNMDTFQHAELVITITFGLQDLPPVRIVGEITTVSINSGTSSSTLRLVAEIPAGIVIGIVVVLGYLFLILRRRQKHRTQTGNPESAEMQPCLPQSKRNLAEMQFKHPVKEHNKVPHLDRDIVPDEKLKCAEYCFNILLNVAIVPRDDIGVTHLRQILTALLNTSGGIIVLENGGSCTGYSETVDEYIRYTESVLLEVIPKSVYYQCVKVFGAHFPLRMLVKKSDKLITINSHMYIRDSGHNNLLSDRETIQHVMSQPTASKSLDPFDNRRSFEYGSPIPFTDDVECVCVPPDQFENARKLNDHTDKSLVALPNMPSGGYFVIGVEDNNTVSGVILQQEENVFSKLIGDFLQTDDDGNPRIWGTEGRSLQQGEDWTIRFIPVTGGPTEEQRSLIVLHLNHCPGGVWAKCPESYMVSEEGSVFAMTFGSWKEAADKTSGVETALIEPIGVEVASSSETSVHDIVTESSSSEKHDTTKSTSAKDDIALKNKIYVAAALNTKENLSFTDHTSLHWKDRLREATTDFYKTAESLAKNSIALQVNKPMTITPTKERIAASFRGYANDIAAAIDRIEAAQDNDVKSFCIITSSWSRDPHSQPGVEWAPGHLLDVFLVDENGRITCWAVVNETSVGYDQKQIATLTLLSGRKTKRNLLLEQPYFSQSTHSYMSTLWVDCHVYEIGHKKVFNLVEESVFSGSARYFNTTKHHLNGIKIALAKMLLKVTTIKSIYGKEYHFTLTSEQLRIIHNLNKFTYVEGLPGSGKTHLALYICKTFRSCGYICTTETFKRYLLYQGIDEGNIICIANTKKVTEDVKRKDFTQFDYLVFDDVHNSPFSKGVWKHICESVASSDRTTLVVFGDTRYQNFIKTRNRKTFISFIRKFCRNTKLSEMELTEIHRNTKNVSSFIAANFKEDTAIPCSHKDEGEDVIVKRISNVWSNPETNGLVKYVKDLIDTDKLEDTQLSHDSREVAILVDISKKKLRAEKNPEKLREIFSDRFEAGTAVQDNMVHDAGRFPVTGLTIDTLSNFMGFDRKVCILVSDENIQRTRQQTGHSFANPKYKAFVASRGTAKVVFIVENELDSSLASKFHCDNVLELRRLWSKPLYVNDVCWLRMDQTAALLYTSHSGASLVSLEGDNLDLTVDTSGIKRSQCVACSTSGQTLVVTDGDTPHSWTVYHRRDPGRYDRKATYGIDRRPASVILISDGYVLMLMDERSQTHLRRYIAADGQLVWETIVDARLLSPGELTVDSAHRVYVCTISGVQVYSPGGEHVSTISVPDDLPDITAVCADSGRRMFTGHEDGSVSLFRDGKIVRRQLIGAHGGHLRSLCLYDDTYLGIISFGQLDMFDVNDVME